MNWTGIFITAHKTAGRVISMEPGQKLDLSKIYHCY